MWPPASGNSTQLRFQFRSTVSVRSFHTATSRAPVCVTGRVAGETLPVRNGLGRFPPVFTRRACSPSGNHRRSLSPHISGPSAGPDSANAAELTQFLPKRRPEDSTAGRARQGHRPLSIPVTIDHGSRRVPEPQCRGNCDPRHRRRDQLRSRRRDQLRSRRRDQLRSIGHQLRRREGHQSRQGIRRCGIGRQ